MEAFPIIFINTFHAALILGLVVLVVIWWYVIYLLFLHSDDNVGRTQFMIVGFLCLICEMARVFDPFTRYEIWSNESLRAWLTIELTMMLALLLIYADAIAWLIYNSYARLMLKPHRRYRHIVFIGLSLLILQCGIVAVLNFFRSSYSRGAAIGWLLSSLIMVACGLLTMYVSVHDVKAAVKIETETQLENPKVSNAIFFTSEFSLDVDHQERESRRKSKKKAKRLAKYMLLVACLFIFDLVITGDITGDGTGKMDLLHLVYDISLKILLAVALVQRRPVTDGRQYEANIHEKYKPFDHTLISGDAATRTVPKLREIVREKTVIEMAKEAKLKQLQKGRVKYEYDKLPPAPIPNTGNATPPLEAAEQKRDIEPVVKLDIDMTVKSPEEVPRPVISPEDEEDDETKGKDGENVQKGQLQFPLSVNDGQMTDGRNEYEENTPMLAENQIYISDENIAHKEDETKRQDVEKEPKGQLQQSLKCGLVSEENGQNTPL